MVKSWKYILGTICLIAVVVWLAVFTFPEPKLHLIACDVGQGDAILAVYGSTQILFDGGPDNKVLDCLSRHMPFWDREIEVVVLTHPQKDHFGGLIEVFKRYKVGLFLANSIDSGSQDYKVLKNVVGGSDTEVVSPTGGMVIRVGLMQLDILWPTTVFLTENSKPSESLRGAESDAGIISQDRFARHRLVPGFVDTRDDNKILGSFTSGRNLNDFSIVASLRLGEFDALMTGDIGPKVIDDILATGKIKDVEYIKIPHHGSKNGISSELLVASDPEVAVISVGANNRYGHPHEEVINLLGEQDIRILRTDEAGDVEVITDGMTWYIKPVSKLAP